MIISKRIVVKTLKTALCIFFIMVLIGSIRVLLLGPVGNKTPGSAPPNFHIATCQEFYDELYYIFGCAIGAVIITLPITLATEFDKERKRMELEQQEKEMGGGSIENISENEKLSDNQQTL